jgi:propionyl-CoA carboxylase beta chain
VTVITRKAYGGAYCVMASKHIRRTSTSRGLRGDRRHGVGRGREHHSQERDRRRGSGGDALRAERVAQYQEKFANPWVAAERGYVDEVIEPAQTRRRLIGCLASPREQADQNPPRKHGNIPL